METWLSVVGVRLPLAPLRQVGERRLTEPVPRRATPPRAN